MEPLDPHDEGDHLPLVELAQRASDDDGPDRDGADRTSDTPTRTWWYVTAAAVLAVVGLVVGIVVFNTSATDPTRGTRTPREAAVHYVSAVNAGDGDSAAGISCDTFLDTARAEARSGEQGIRYRLVSVRVVADDTASAVISASLSVSGATQRERLTINVFKSGGLWLMCGQD